LTLMPLRYLLDTNVISETMREVPDAHLLRRVLQVGDAAAIGAPTWHELEFGAARLPEGRRRRTIEALLARMEVAVQVLPYDRAAAQWHARERARLVRRGKTPPFVDGQLAAIAVTNDLVFVTRNVRDFTEYVGLRVESWLGKSR